MRLYMSGLSILLGSDRPVEFDQKAILTRLEVPTVLTFLAQAGVDVEAIRQAVKTAEVFLYPPNQKKSLAEINTDLFPRSSTI